jgi:hypothetical protein
VIPDRQPVRRLQPSAQPLYHVVVGMVPRGSTVLINWPLPMKHSATSKPAL